MKSMTTTMKATVLLSLLSSLLLAAPHAVNGQFAFSTNNGALTITGYTGLGGDVVIPSEANGLTVVNVGDYAFQFVTSLTRVTIPDSITNIGSYAFYKCYGLTSVKLGNGIANIGIWAFAYCSSLTNLTIPSSVTNLGGGAFIICPKLQSIVFLGNAPAVIGGFPGTPAAIYYLPGNNGWGSVYAGCPAYLWNPSLRVSRGGFHPQVGYDVMLTISGSTNMPIVVETTTNLTSGVWETLKSCGLTNGTTVVTDPATHWTRSRFYRTHSP
jgi:hypothetical protein